MKRVLILMLAISLDCCKESKTEQPTPQAPASQASATPAATSSQAGPASSGTSMGVDGAMPVTAFFEGPSPSEVKLGKLLGSGPRLAVPDGWKGDDNLYSGMVIASHPSGAKVMAHYVGPGKVSEKNRDFWVRAPLEAPSVTWEADTDARLGKSAIPGTAAKGAGKSGKHEADFYSFRNSTAGHGYLVVAVLPKSTEPAVRQQAIAAARSATFN